MPADEDCRRLEELSRTTNERSLNPESTYCDEDLACGAAIPNR